MYLVERRGGKENKNYNISGNIGTNAHRVKVRNERIRKKLLLPSLSKRTATILICAQVTV